MSLRQEVPIYPWTKVATDIFLFRNELYLLIVDYTSRFLVVHKLTSTTPQQVASQMKLIFSEYSWPETIVSDNRPCYSAKTFTKPMTDCSLNHITSSPYYPQSNGLAEKHVQIVKIYSIKLKTKAQISTKVWWYTEIPNYQIDCSHLCRSCNHKLLEPNYQCLMQ